MVGRTPIDLDDLWALADKNGGVLTHDHFETLGGAQRFGTFKNVRRRFSARHVCIVSLCAPAMTVRSSHASLGRHRLCPLHTSAAARRCLDDIRGSPARRSSRILQVRATRTMCLAVQKASLASM